MQSRRDIIEQNKEKAIVDRQKEIAEVVQSALCPHCHKGALVITEIRRKVRCTEEGCGYFTTTTEGVTIKED